MLDKVDIERKNEHEHEYARQATHFHLHTVTRLEDLGDQTHRDQVDLCHWRNGVTF
ncbi:hypothetical protein PM082_006717 [Marasmius tenuissimus]|nr:hypothetical protein PM082_006717 [Marasmius tenuissimus]